MNVLIIGGGIIGTAIAHELAHSGMKCTVVDKALPGNEATSAAAGILGAQVEAKEPGPFFELLLRSRTLYHSWIRRIEAESKLNTDYDECGLIHAAFTPEELEHLELTFQWQRDAKKRVRRLTGSEAIEEEPGLGARPEGALLFEDDHAVDNRKLFTALLHATKDAGVRYRVATVTALDQSGGRVTGAVTESGEVLHADVTILCAGAWSSTIGACGLPSTAVVPVRGQLMEVKVMTVRTRRILKRGRHYVVPRRDGRVVLGTTVENVGYDKSVTAEGLADVLAEAKHLMPAISRGQVTSSWAGLRPSTSDGLPLLGPSDRPGLVYATGHFRNGILLAPMTARLVRELLRGDKMTQDLSPFRFSRFSL